MCDESKLDSFLDLINKDQIGGLLPLHKMGIKGLGDYLGLDVYDHQPQLLVLMFYTISIDLSFVHDILRPIELYKSDYELKCYEPSKNSCTIEELDNIEVQSNINIYYYLSLLPLNYIHYCLSKIDGISTNDLLTLQQLILRKDKETEFVKLINESNYNTIICGKQAYHFAYRISANTIDFQSVYNDIVSPLSENDSKLFYKNNHIHNKTDDFEVFANDTINYWCNKLVKDYKRLMELFQECPSAHNYFINNGFNKLEIWEILDKAALDEASKNYNEQESIEFTSDIMKRAGYGLIYHNVEITYIIDQNLSFEEQLSVLSNALPY